MPVDEPAGRTDWGRIALLHAAASPCIRFVFNARHTKAHSPRAWSRPRTLKRRKPSRRASVSLRREIRRQE